MALRDIFDNDPRSKEQLRKELIARSQTIFELTERVEDLSTSSIATRQEAEKFREKFLAEQFQSQKLDTELRSEKIQAQNLISEVAKLTRELRDTNQSATWTPAQIARLEEREKVVSQNFTELQRRGAFFAELGPLLPAVPSTDPASQAHAKLAVELEEVSKKYAKLLPRLNEYRLETDRLKQELTDLKLQIARQKRTDQYKSAIEREKSEQLRDDRFGSTRSAINSKWDAAEIARLEERERLVLKNFSELQKREGALSDRAARIMDVPPPPPPPTTTQIAPIEKLKFQETIKELKKNVALLNGELTAASESLAHVVKQKLAEEERLAASLSREKHRADQLQKALSQFPVAKPEAIPTLLQEEVLAWMFKETYRGDLRVAEGYLHLMGDGPWGKKVFERLMKAQEFELWPLPDADIAHLVLGRNKWSPDDLLAQIKARQGQSLRIYSQEMWFAAMATGRDPFDADDPKLLQAFAADHEALQFLIGQEMPWPLISDRPLGSVTIVGPGELGVLESPMHLMDYRVGKTSPHSEVERHAILSEIFSEKSLQFGDDCSPTYRANWGPPKTAQRLYRMATHIKTLIDGLNGNDYRRPVARQDWIDDLAWLKKTYFRKTVHAFQWPSTHVP